MIYVSNFGYVLVISTLLSDRLDHEPLDFVKNVYFHWFFYPEFPYARLSSSSDFYSRLPDVKDTNASQDCVTSDRAVWEIFIPVLKCSKITFTALLQPTGPNRIVEFRKTLV